MIMKGAIAGVELMGKILIAIFIVGVIVILFMTFVPNVFQGSFCIDKQRQNINDIVGDAISKRTVTIRDFTVESCVEYVDFSPVGCKMPGTDKEKRCYEVGFVGGQGESNCEKLNVRSAKVLEDGTLEEESVGILDPITDPIADAVAPEGEKGSGYCESHRGQFVALTGTLNTFDIQPCDSCGGRMRYTPGKYPVRVGQYSIEFMSKLTDDVRQEEEKGA